MLQDQTLTANYVPQTPFHAATVHLLKIRSATTRLNPETQCAQSPNLNSTRLDKIQPFPMRANLTSPTTWPLASAKTTTLCLLPKLKLKPSPALTQPFSSKHLPTSWSCRRIKFAHLSQTLIPERARVTKWLETDGLLMNSRCSKTTGLVQSWRLNLTMSWLTWTRSQRQQQC